MNAEEAAIYDRQIRLWGLSSQLLIKKAIISVINVTPTTMEISKNLVLAGIAALSVLDTSNITEKDLDCFLFNEGHVGQRKDKVVIDYLKTLNPRVEISAADTDSDVTVLGSNDVNEWLKVEAKLKSTKSSLYVTATSKSYAFMFSDPDRDLSVLKSHSWTEKRIKKFQGLAYFLCSLSGLSIDAYQQKTGFKGLTQDGMTAFQNEPNLPLAPILGGVTSQEILKAVTNQETLKNAWFYWGNDVIKELK